MLRLIYLLGHDQGRVEGLLVTEGHAWEEAKEA